MTSSRQDPPLPSRERLKEALHALGNPHHNLSPVIHVTGTNGKGSTLAFMESCLQAEGYTVNSFTSPHVFEWQERIKINGAPISKETFEAALERTKKVSKNLTLFDTLTLSAFYLFSEKPGDITLLEVGVGGTFSSTNVIDNVLATVFTPIGIDHQDILGPTLSEITQEKAGLMQKGSLAFSASQDANILSILKESSMKLQCPLFYEGQNWHLQQNSKSAYFSWAPQNGATLSLPTLKMPGKHQNQNAALALATLQGIQEHFPLSKKALIKGLSKAQLPGRLQKVDLFSKGPEVWFDGAHNPHAAKRLAHFIEARWGRKSITLVLGRSRPCLEEVQNIAKPLAPFIKRLILTGGQDLQDPNIFSQGLKNLKGTPLPQIFGSIQESLDFAKQFPEPILLTGSLYLAGHLKTGNFQAS